MRMRFVDTAAGWAYTATRPLIFQYSNSMFGLLELTLGSMLATTYGQLPAATAPPAAQAPSSAPASAPATGPLSGYMDFHLNQPTDGTPAILDFHRFVLLFTHRFSDRLRFVGELELEHAVVEGLEEGGELELEQAYLDFLVKPRVQLPRRHGARAGRHHQRAARAAGLPRRRAAVRRYRDRADDVVRGGRRRARRASAAASAIAPTRWRRSTRPSSRPTKACAERRSRASRRKSATSRSRAGSSTSALRGLQTGVELLARRHRLQRAAHRHHGRPLRARRALLARPARSARAVRARVHQRRRRAERRDGAARPASIPNIAEQLRGFYLEGRLPRPARPRAPRRRGVRALRELRHAVPDARRATCRCREFDRDAWVVGATYWVDPDVAIKFDYSHVRNQSDVVPAPRSFNVGLGWWF